MPSLRLLDFVLNLPQRGPDGPHRADTHSTSIQAPYYAPGVTLKVRQPTPKGSLWYQWGRERESPYLPRRDELAWDLDKRETRGAEGGRSRDGGSKARCQEEGNAHNSRKAVLRGFT